VLKLQFWFEVEDRGLICNCFLLDLVENRDSWGGLFGGRRSLVAMVVWMVVSASWLRIETLMLLKIFFLTTTLGPLFLRLFSTWATLELIT
jgi:hypothetical protein